MVYALRNHWPMYIYELLGLAWVLLVAGIVASALWAPLSPLGAWVPSELARRGVMVVSMADALVAFIYSPAGQTSGAHINPAVTLTFFALGRVEPWDAAFYVVAQFLGATLGVAVAALVMGSWAAHPAVNFILTVPGAAGVWAAFAVEVAITFALMSVVLIAVNNLRLARFTGILAGSSLALIIVVATPVSGASLNPARSFGSAAIANVWQPLWLYLVAPVLGALLAGAVYTVAHRGGGLLCAKLHHHNRRQCIFRCGYREAGIDPLAKGATQ